MIGFLCLKEYNRLGMKVYQYHLNYRASRDTNPEWMGVTHTQDIRVTIAMSEILSFHWQQCKKSTEP